MKILALCFFILLTSCSTFNKDREKKESAKVSLEGYRPLTSLDYIDHIKAFEAFYLDSKEVKVYPLTAKEKNYLTEIASELVKNNELFFKSKVQPSFRVVKSPVPFHFSLPGLRIFLSSGLIAKYIKSEKLLYSVIAYELIRSEKNIYKKAQIVPTGFMSTSRALSLLRLNTNEKVEVHKWAFYTLKRVGVDPDIYLSWLQIQNRNSVDFSLQLGDISSISREESLFKAFIVENAKKKNGQAKYERSSKDFYAFVNRLKR
ncbi:MAG: hypothetical protein WEB87_02880 [Bacteriovoracaceae bacterium]